MGGLIDLALEPIVHWRLGLTTLVAIPVAMFLADTLSRFTGQFGIELVLIAHGAGLPCQMSAPARPAAANARAQEQTTR